MTREPGQRQIPIRCSSCMGPATPHYDGRVECGFCGRSDRLPADELGRALEVKRRLAAAARSVAQMRGLESTLGHIFESRGAFLRVSGMWLALVPVILGWQLLGGWDIIAKVPDNMRVAMIVQMLVGPMFVAGVGVAMVAALAVGRIGYRRRVRHLLFAHAPREPGLPARCRACDGDLPDKRTAFVICDYCTTQNLVTPELQRDRERLLQEESAFYRDRANRSVAATSRSGLHMSRVFGVCLVLVYAGNLALAYLASSLLPT